MRKQFAVATDLRDFIFTVAEPPPLALFPRIPTILCLFLQTMISLSYC